MARMCCEDLLAIGRCASGGHGKCFRGTCAYARTTLLRSRPPDMASPKVAPNSGRLRRCSQRPRSLLLQAGRHAQPKSQKGSGMNVQSVVANVGKVGPPEVIGIASRVGDGGTLRKA